MFAVLGMPLTFLRQLDWVRLLTICENFSKMPRSLSWPKQKRLPWQRKPMTLTRRPSLLHRPRAPAHLVALRCQQVLILARMTA